MHRRMISTVMGMVAAGWCFFCGSVNGALVFDGKNDYVVVKRDLTGGVPGITICAWIAAGSSSNIFSFDSALLHSHNLGFYLIGHDGRESGYLTWNPDPLYNEWQFIGATWQGSVEAPHPGESGAGQGIGKMRLYLNGVRQQDELSFAGGPKGRLYGTPEMRIGKRFNQWRDFYKGKTEDVRVYNRALSSDEMMRVYQSGGYDGVTDGLILRWALNEKKKGGIAAGADTIRDVSGKGNNGTPLGAPVYLSSEEEIAQCQKVRDRIGSCFNVKNGSALASFKPKYEELNQAFDRMMSREERFAHVADDLLKRYEALETKVKFEILFIE